MKRILQFTIALLIAVFAIKDAEAQRNRRSGSISFGGQILQPLGDFSTQYDGYPAGLGGNLSIPLWRSPLEFGVGYAWNSMGSQNEEVSVYVTTDKDGDDIYENGTMRIRSSINRYQTFARFRPFAGKIQPYADAIMGIDVFKTTNDITIDNDGYSEATNSERNHQDVTYAIGWAAGLRVRLAPNIFVEGRFENLSSGKVTYVDQSSIVVTDDDNISFETKESRANRYVYQVGLAISF